MMRASLRQPFPMSITITLSKSVTEQDLDNVLELVQYLQESDFNFLGRAIRVQRGFVTTVEDTDDALRGALLRLLVESVLSAPRAK